MVFEITEYRTRAWQSAHAHRFKTQSPMAWKGMVAFNTTHTDIRNENDIG